MLNQVHAELTKGWEVLRRTVAKLDRIEKAIAAREVRPEPRGRETPIFLERSFSFTPFTFEEHTLPLVMPAQRTTKIVRLTHTVTFENDATVAGAPYIGPTMRTKPMCMAWDSSALAETAVSLFDFEWTFRIGSTDRRYTNGRSGAAWNARQALGDPEVRRQLLVDERNPIVLGTNEFLTFSVKPIMYNMDPTWLYDTNARFVVHLIATGYRVFDV